jgi:predicted PurR-regulated permease PerM
MALEDVIAQLFSDPQNNIIFMYFLPFLFLTVLFFGGLELIRAFRKRTNTLLAMLFALMAFPTYTWFSLILIPLGSYAAIILFITFFGVFTVRYAFSRGRDIWFETMTDANKLRKLEERLQKEYKRLNKAYDRGQDGKAIAINQNIKVMESQIEALRRKQMMGGQA